MRLDTTVQGHRLTITYHCIDRYIERVKCIPNPTPDERSRFSHELCYLIRKHGVVEQSPPDWVGLPEETDRKTIYYVTVGEDITFPVGYKEFNAIELLAMTCLTRGEFSPARRANRNRIKRERRQAIRARRLNEAYRGERAQRWQ